MADLRHLEGAKAGAGPPSCSSDSTWSRGSAAGCHLLRWHASPARPRDEPGRRSADHLPGRADHRPGSAQPPHDVADIRDLVDRRGHDLPDDAIPGGGGSSSPTGSRSSTGAGWSRKGPPTSSSGRVPGGHVRLQFADAGTGVGRPSPGWSTATTTPSSCRSRATAATACSAPCSTGSTGESIEVERSTVHTPDLDDVFLALTGHTDEERGPLDEHAVLCP